MADEDAAAGPVVACSSKWLHESHTRLTALSRAGTGTKWFEHW